MDIKITFRHMEKSEPMEQHAYAQLEKIIEFLKSERPPIMIHLIVEPSKAREHHRVELLVKTPHYDLITHYEKQGMPFYETLDHVIDTMYRQLHEVKRERIESRKHVARADEFLKKRD